MSPNRTLSNSKRSNLRSEPQVPTHTLGLFAKSARGVLVLVGAAFAWWAVDLGEPNTRAEGVTVVHSLAIQAAESPDDNLVSGDDIAAEGSAGSGFPDN